MITMSLCLCMTVLCSISVKESAAGMEEFRSVKFTVKIVDENEQPVTDAIVAFYGNVSCPQEPSVTRGVDQFGVAEWIAPAVKPGDWVFVAPQINSQVLNEQAGFPHLQWIIVPDSVEAPQLVIRRKRTIVVTAAKNVGEEIGMFQVNAYHAGAHGKSGDTAATLEHMQVDDQGTGWMYIMDASMQRERVLRVQASATQNEVLLDGIITMVPALPSYAVEVEFVDVPEVVREWRRCGYTDVAFISKNGDWKYSAQYIGRQGRQGNEVSFYKYGTSLPVGEYYVFIGSRIQLRLWQLKIASMQDNVHLLVELPTVAVSAPEAGVNTASAVAIQLPWSRVRAVDAVFSDLPSQLFGF